MPLPYTFANTTGSNPLAHLDANFSYCLQNPIKAVNTSGSVSTYTATPDPAWTSYLDGQQILVEANSTNSGGVTPTLNVSGLGPKPIFRDHIGSTDLIDGQFKAGVLYLLQYNTDVNGFSILKIFAGLNDSIALRNNVAGFIITNNYETIFSLRVNGGPYSGAKLLFTGSGYSDGTYQYFGETPVSYGAGTITSVIGRLDFGSDIITVGTRTLTVSTGSLSAFSSVNFDVSMVV